MFNVNVSILLEQVAQTCDEREIHEKNYHNGNFCDDCFEENWDMTNFTCEVLGISIYSAIDTYKVMKKYANKFGTFPNVDNIEKLLVLFSNL